MKRLILATIIAVNFMVATQSFADPITGKWTWTGSGCFQEMTMYASRTLSTWLACWDDTNQCYNTAEGYGNWQKAENGTYFLTYDGVTDMLLVKGTVATDFFNRTFLKSITFDKTKSAIYGNACK